MIREVSMEAPWGLKLSSISSATAVDEEDSEWGFVVMGAWLSRRVMRVDA